MQVVRIYVESLTDVAVPNVDARDTDEELYQKYLIATDYSGLEVTTSKEMICHLIRRQLVSNAK